MAKVRGIADLGIFHVQGQPNLEHQDRPRQGRALRSQFRRRQYRGPGGASAAPRRRPCWRATGSSTSTVRLQRPDRLDIDAIKTSRSATPAGGGNAYLPLERACRHLARHRRVLHLSRTRRALSFPSSSRVRGRDLGGTVAEAQERIADRRQAADRLSHRLGGRVRGSRERQRAADGGGSRSPSCLILVLLYGLFNSMRDSLVALAGIPFASSAALSRSTFPAWTSAISAAIGFISLFGVAVMDGILNITYLPRAAHAAAWRSTEAVFHGAEQRMRPMLMTALSAGIGLLPAAISTRHRQPGAEAAGDRGGRRHDHRPDHAAGGRACHPQTVPAQGRDSSGGCIRADAPGTDEPDVPEATGALSPRRI